jgi:asparagine synthase (glutamine-hydrolysing)
MRYGTECGFAEGPVLVERMVHALAHRAPAHHAVWVGDGAALGLRLIDGSTGAGRPPTNEDARIVSVADGTVLNEDRLRDALGRGGHRLRGERAEVIPHLYEQHGAAFPKQLRGDFAVAVWDAERRRAVLARDRQGVKPLYYAVLDDVLLFASELKALLATGLVAPELDYESIDAYLDLGFIPAPRTIVAGVSQLYLGTCLVADAQGARTEAYWKYPEPRPDDPPSSEAEYCERVIATLEEATRARLVGDRPVGVMLSGGLDSSVVLALAARNSSDPVKTFSIGFAESRESNELAEARRVAATFGADHHEIELSFVQDTIELTELVWRLDEPAAELSALGLFALAELAGPEVGAALSGQGADGILGGLSDHRNAALAGRLDRVPQVMRTAGAAVLARGPRPVARGARLVAAHDPVDRFLAACDAIPPDLRERLCCGPLAAHSGSARRAIARRLGAVDGNPAANYIFVDEQLAAVDSVMHYNDRASTGGPIEIRFPFLDQHFVEYGARIPVDLKVKGLTGKYLLRIAARGLVPHWIITRRKVGFFNAAVAAWIRSRSDGEISDYLLGPSPRYAEFLDRDAVEALVERHRRSEGAGYGGLLLAILILEVWLSSALPRALAASRLAVRLGEDASSGRTAVA